MSRVFLIYAFSICVCNGQDLIIAQALSDRMWLNDSLVNVKTRISITQHHVYVHQNGQVLDLNVVHREGIGNQLIVMAEVGVARALVSCNEINTRMLINYNHRLMKIMFVHQVVDGKPMFILNKL